MIPQYNSGQSSTFPSVNFADLTVFFTSSVINDLAILMVETGAEAAPTPSGWSVLASAPQDATSTRLSAFYKLFVAAGETSVTVTDPGDHAFGFVHVFRHFNAAAPFGNSAGQVNASSTTCTFPSITKTSNESLIFGMATAATDTGVFQFGSPVNANLTSTIITNYATATGNGGCIFSFWASGLAGVIGETTVTISTASATAAIILEIMPVPIQVAERQRGTDAYSLWWPPNKVVR